MWCISKREVGASLAILMLLAASAALAGETPREGAQCRVPLLALDAYAEVVRARDLLALSTAAVAAMERLAAWQMVAGEVDRDDRELSAGIVQRQKDAAAYLGRDERRLRQAEARLAGLAGLAVSDWVSVDELEGLLRSGSAVRQVAEGGLRLPCEPVPASVRRLKNAPPLAAARTPVTAGVAFLADRVRTLERQRELQRRVYTTGKPILRSLLATQWELIVTRRQLAEARFRQVMQGFVEAHPGIRLADVGMEMPAATEPAALPAAKPAPAPASPRPSTMVAAAETVPQIAAETASADGDAPTTPEEPPAAKPAGSPPAEKVARAPDPKATDAAVEAAILAWRDAWQARDIPAYLAHYAADFRPGRGRSRAQWERYRRRVIGKARDIHIAIEGLAIERHGSRAVARFHQRYRASNYRDETDKELVLKREQGEWKIVAERSR